MIATCVVEGCANKQLARKMCSKHWQRWRNHGDPSILEKTPLPDKCDVIGCDRKPHSRWDGKSVCNMHWQRLYYNGTEDERKTAFASWSMCCVNGCDKPSRSPGNGVMCEMHYARTRRTGNTEIIKQQKQRAPHSFGYITMTDRDHPLASKGGYLYTHRKLLFDRIGWGKHTCHWCGCVVEWMPGEKTKKGAIVVDHLNGNKKDNNDYNLVPSCHQCNATRGLFQKWVREHGEDAASLMTKIKQ